MLTEEQIQRLAEITAGEHGFDEEECKEHVRFIDNLSEVVLVFLPEEKQELFKKTLEGEFFEYLIQGYFRVGAEIVKIARIISLKKQLAQLSIDLSRVSRGIDVVP